MSLSCKTGAFPPPVDAWSLPPDGSRTQLLAVSLGQCNFRPTLHRLAGDKQGLNFRRGPLFIPQAFDSPKEWKWFQGLG